MQKLLNFMFSVILMVKLDGNIEKTSLNSDHAVGNPSIS